MRLIRNDYSVRHWDFGLFITFRALYSPIQGWHKKHLSSLAHTSHPPAICKYLKEAGSLAVLTPGSCVFRHFLPD